MSDPLVTSALIGGGVSLFNNLFGSASAKSSQARQFEYQKQLNQQQFDLQKQMFDYTSEYNSASNQVQRLKDAGLNPNLAYGGAKREETAKHIQEMDANISYKKALAVTTAYQVNLMAAEIGEKNAQAFLHLEQRTWQALRNGDYEKLTDKEIERINSEIDKNYRKQSSGDYGFNAKVGPFSVGWKYGAQHQYDSR